MATVTILQPVSEDAEFRKKTAQQHWKAIQQSGPLVSMNSLRIGFHAAALKRDGLFGILGYENEKQAQEASGVKQATWYNVLRIAEAFPNVEEKLFCAMRLTNAECLMDLPESKRLTEFWLRRAATDSIDAFQEAVDKAMDGKEKASNGRERIVPFSVKMPRSRKKAVEAGLLEFGKSAGCDGDQSRALELLVAEKTGTPSLVGVITGAVQKLKSIKELCESSIMSSDEILAKVLVMNEEMILDFAAALDGIQGAEE